MIYNLISGDEIVRRLSNDHNITIATELARFPKWIYQALEKLKLLQGWVPASHYATIVDGFVDLPTDIRYLIGVEYNGNRLSRKDYPLRTAEQTLPTPLIYDVRFGLTINGTIESISYDEDTLSMSANIIDTRRYDYMTILNAAEDTSNYYVLLHKKMELSIDTGHVWLYYYKFPCEYNDQFAIYMPLIPDNEEVIEYITFYLILCMLQRGYKHPVYNLNENNEYTNMGIKFKKAKIPALNSANAWDKDKATNILKSWNAAFYNLIANID